MAAKCKHCGGALPKRKAKGPPRQYCGPQCRMAARKLRIADAMNGKGGTGMEGVIKRKAPVVRGVRNKAKVPDLKLVETEFQPISRARALKADSLIPGYDPGRGAADYRFDYDKGRAVVQYFHDELRHSKGEWSGQPFDMQPWQQALLMNLFGWLDLKTGLRRYRETFIFVPRKNGKTPLAAAILMYILDRDDEPGAELYGAAAKYGQAAKVWEHARGMVLRNKRLNAEFQLFKGQQKAIQKRDDLSTYVVIASDSPMEHGGNTHAFVVDEVHALPNADLIEVLETSIGARRQPLKIFITTADYAREGSPCNAMYDRACQVRDGIAEDPQLLPVIWEADKDADWTDLAVVKRANPNYGVSVKPEYLQAELRKAQQMLGRENLFRRLHLNQRTEQDVRWLSMAAWDACDETISEAELVGRPCFAGLDLSSTRDITALCLLFTGDTDESTYYVLPYLWVPASSATERERTDRVPYPVWAQQGHIELTDGNVVDYDRIRAKINELGKQFDIREIAIDRWNSTQLQTQLIGDGFDVIPFGQGFQSMTAPMKELEKLVVSGRLAHGGHPVLRWMASNVTVEQDAAGNLKPSKKKSTERIDGIVALGMALGRAMVAEPAVEVGVMLI